ncbi:MAG: hypothetical protein JWO61_399 [Candidatus Saccharibacteria bacterium]|nr:hypothetical protein [Candidatus Saccharibacteria bacterium]
MEVVYYLTSFLLVLGVPALIVATVVYLIKPNLINKRKYIKNPLSRGKIAGIGLTAIAIALIGFGTVLAATEPASVKEARLAREAAASQIEQTKLQQQKDAIEKEKLKQVEAAKPKIKVETKTEAVVFESIEQNDATVSLGEKRVSTEGVNGERTITYEVTYVDGKETSRKETKNEVTKAPVNKLTLVGTYVKPAPAPAVSSSPTYTAPSGGARTGAICNDGSSSSATGSGACSHHGGVAYWLY